MASSWCRLTDRAYAAGDSPAGARPWDEVRAPPGAQRSVSFRAINARPLQALVRQRGAQGWPPAAKASSEGANEGRSPLRAPAESTEKRAAIAAKTRHRS